MKLVKPEYRIRSTILWLGSVDRPENHETTGFKATCHGRQISQSAADKTFERLLGLEVGE